MESADPNLLGLPAELRAQILELVTYHTKTKGVISPTLIDSDKGLKSSKVLVEDARWELQQNGWPKCFEVDPGVNFRESRTEQTAKREYKENVWTASPNFCSMHYCTLSCLLQPPVAMVNRLLRQEALPLFYGTNHFHLEIMNFHVHNYGSQESCVMLKSPVDWYRAIGTENIKQIE